MDSDLPPLHRAGIRKDLLGGAYLRARLEQCEEGGRDLYPFLLLFSGYRSICSVLGAERKRGSSLKQLVVHKNVTRVLRRKG